MMQAVCPLVGCVLWLRTGALLPIFLEVCALYEDAFVIFNLEGKSNSGNITNPETPAGLSRSGQATLQQE